MSVLQNNHHLQGFSKQVERAQRKVHARTCGLSKQVRRYNAEERGDKSRVNSLQTKPDGVSK